jgi:hypothetical protein
VTERTEELSDHQWVAIDVAAEALGVTEGQARRIAKKDHWRHDHGWPRAYNFGDIVKSHKKRKETP